MLTLGYRFHSQTTYRLGRPLTLTFAIRNPSSEDVWILKWYTPLEGLRGRILTVRCDGVDVPYEGRMMKRGEPTDSDYVLVAAGGEVVAEFDLAQSYPLAACTACQVDFRGRLHDAFAARARSAGPIARPAPEHQSLEVRGQGVSFRIVGA